MHFVWRVLVFLGPYFEWITKISFFYFGSNNLIIFQQNSICIFPPFQYVVSYGFHPTSLYFFVRIGLASSQTHRVSGYYAETSERIKENPPHFLLGRSCPTELTAKEWAVTEKNSEFSSGWFFVQSLDLEKFAFMFNDGNQIHCSLGYNFDILFSVAIVFILQFFWIRISKGSRSPTNFGYTLVIFLVKKISHSAFGFSSSLLIFCFATAPPYIHFRSQAPQYVMIPVSMRKRPVFNLFPKQIKAYRTPFL